MQYLDFRMIGLCTMIGETMTQLDIKLMGFVVWRTMPGHRPAPIGSSFCDAEWDIAWYRQTS